MKKKAVARGALARKAHRSWVPLLMGTCLSTVVAGAATVSTPVGPSHASGGQPPLLAHATDLGPVNASGSIEITVWLNLHDSAGLDETLAAQHDRKADWLSNEQIAARHAPAAADIAAVSGFLEKQGLTVTGVGPENLFVKARGTVASVQSAFKVELHQYNLRGRTVRANTSDPKLPAEIASLVASVGGLSDLAMRPMTAHPKPATGARSNIARTADAEGLAPLTIPLAAQPDGLYFSAQCFYPPISKSFSGGGASATYQGNRYGADITNPSIGSLPPCGYQPSDLQTAYNLTPLYKAGLDGTGVTVAITDAYGSKTVAADLATFSQAMGLPTPSLTVIGTSTGTTYSTNSDLAGWAEETTLDVEWVHAIAPKAKILLVVAPTNNDDDLYAAIATAAAQPGVVAISNSWAGYESLDPSSDRAAADTVLKLADAKGIAVNFASGDEGDEVYDLGYVDVDYPASSPYATGVGGVSVGLDHNKHITFQSAWGNNITEVADTVAQGSPPIDPPFNEAFIYGGGGGTSNVYPQPSFQRGLGGERRLVPDVSWVADPYTGVEIIYTTSAQGAQSIGVIGGTSLATPMFTALWGIASQAAHHALGQAAPYLYKLPRGAINDVQAVTSPSNVTGVLQDADGTQNLTSWELAMPIQGQQSFYSALYNSPNSTRWFVLTFGMDSTLQAGPGWDPATGVGTPSGWDFVQAFAENGRH